MKKKIIAAFKTHFDYGYTDTAERVLEHYCTDVLQKAVEVCEHSQKFGDKLEYKWTLPAFLLVKMYERSSETIRVRLEKLVQRGQIVCHALPFTMHTPLLNEQMLRHMFIYTEEYCRIFGRPFPIAAKMTDVPGHCSAIIEPLVSHGVKFLHLGKNPACPSPDVPALFWWEDLKGNRILTFYSKGYGTEILPPKDWRFPVWLAMLHTGDNVGCQNIEFISECRNKIPQDTVFVTGTLDDFAEEILRCDLSELPVIRGELGDTWIHGAGTYPRAMSVYRRSLRRFHLTEKAAKQSGKDIGAYSEAFYKQALVFAEHTFGVNVLRFLGKARCYDKASLSLERAENPNYRLAEKSWREQEGYADELWAICERAENAVGKSTVRKGKFLDFEVRAKGSSLVVIVSGEEKYSLTYEYIVFGQSDLHGYMKEYLERFWEWSLSDYGRYCYPSVRRKRYLSKITNIEKTPTGFSVDFTQRDESFQEFGNFRIIRVLLSLTDAGLHIRFDGKGKEATAMVEAGNLILSLHRRGEKFLVRQGDQDIDVRKDIVRGANHNLWAVNEYAAIDDTVLYTYDAPLVSFGKNGICKYWKNTVRSDAAVFAVNLFNNHWGTNFPQWLEGDFSYEFLLTGRRDNDRKIYSRQR